MKITYREENGRFYPNLVLPDQTNYTIGKYGLLHLDYIKEHRKGRYTTLLSESRLNEHLHKIDLEASEMLESIITNFATERGIDENLEKTFTDEQKEIFEKFHDCWDEYVSLAEAAIFEYAFRLGAKLTLEIHKDEE